MKHLITRLAEPEGQRQERLGFASLPNQQAQVAILIRSLDRATLGRALESVALQTYPNIEVHILNASGQPHRQVSEQIGQHRVSFHDPGVRVQRSAAANQLLDHASGDFALFLDDDDWLAADHIARLVKVLEEHPEAAGAYAGVEYGQLINGSWQPESVFNDTFDRYRLLFENYLPIHSVLFRQSLTRKQKNHQGTVCRFDESLDLFEDWDFWLQLTAHAPFVHVNGVSAYYVGYGDGNSAVFEQGDMQQETRRRLQAKWLTQLDVETFHQFLDYVRSIYREKGTLQERLTQCDARFATTDQHNQSLKALVAARDEELDHAQQHAASMQAVLAARDEELDHAQQHVASMQAVLAARDEELDHAQQHVASMQAVLAARDEELDHAQQHVASMQAVLAARDEELDHAQQHAASMQAVLAAWDEELDHAQQHAASMQAVLAARDEELDHAQQHAASMQAVLAARDEELDHAQQHAASMQAVLAARDEELDHAQQHVASMQAVLAARDEELDHAQQHAASMQAVLAARDEELDHAQQHAASMQAVLAARDEELDHAQQHAASMQAVLAAREIELQNLHVHTANLNEVISARDSELKNLQEHASALSIRVAERDKKISELRGFFWPRKRHD